MKFYVGWWSDSGVTERKRGRTEKKKKEHIHTKKRKEELGEGGGDKRKKENKGESKSVRRQELQAEKEKRKVDEKECKERNVGGFQRRARGTVAPARRIETIGYVFSWGFNRTFI